MSEADWPGWTLETWTHFWDGRWPPFLIGLGGLETREEFIENAWNHPLGPEGLQSSFSLSVSELADPKSIDAAQRWGQKIQSQTGSYIYGVRAGVAQLVIPGVFLCAIRSLNSGRDVINVIGVRNSGGNATGAANAVSVAWQIAGGPLARLSSLVQFTGVHSMDLSSPDGAIADLVVTGKVGGITLTNSLSTAAASALVKWNGGTRSGSSRGRLYYGPLMENQIQTDGRNLQSTELTGIQGAFTAFRNSLDSGGYPLVVVSRKNATATTVTSSAVETTIATQRRRIRS